MKIIGVIGWIMMIIGEIASIYTAATVGDLFFVFLSILGIAMIITLVVLDIRVKRKWKAIQDNSKEVDPSEVSFPIFGVSNSIDNPQ